MRRKFQMVTYTDPKQLNHYLAYYQLNTIIHHNLQEHHVFHAFKKGELICVLGEPLSYFYILLEGDVKVFTTSVDGKILSLRIFNPPINLGDIELMNNTGYRCHVEALTDSVCLAFPIQIIRSIGLNQPAFLRYLCSDLCQKFDSIASTSSHNLLYPLRNRLVSYMMEYLDQDTRTITFPFSHTALAELLGITYRHLTRSLSELENQGLIKVEGQVIHVTDEAKLSQLSMDIYPHRQ